MRTCIFTTILAFFSLFLYPQAEVIEIDFLKDLNLSVNGAGPLLIKADPHRNRVLLVNTITSSISVINSKTDRVENIPMKGRIPQYLKDEAFALDPQSGNGYIIGNKIIHILFTDEKKSIAINTKYQFDMVAIDEGNGNALLTGRETRKIGFLDLKKKKIKYTRCFLNEEVMKNLNQTPPPPIRKVVFDRGLKKFFALDGFSSKLFTISAKTGTAITSRKLKSKEGSRWHFAGYNSDNHHLYAVIETAKRKVTQALKIDTKNGNDIFIDLPELSEGVGINYNYKRDEIYIPYDNHPIVHIVGFSNGGKVTTVKLPAYGNDASAVDEEGEKLYISSWAYGEIDIVDLKSRKLIHRIRDIGILPHMFSMAYNHHNKKLYIPLGATAVNGSWGSSVSILDTKTFNVKKVMTGWSPMAIIRSESLNRFLVFNSEDEFAEVSSEGKYVRCKLPVSYPGNVINGEKNNLYLSYGPHQSYWPAVYIWASKNGILEIEPKRIDTSGDFTSNYQFFDRRIPRLAHGMVTDKTGSLYCLQNSWGKEKLFLSHFPDGIRLFAPQQRWETDQVIARETIPRIIRYDPQTDRIYVVICGEENENPGKILIMDPKTKKVDHVIGAGNNPTDLVFDENSLYISNFDSDTVTKIDKKTGAVIHLKTGSKPLRLALSDNKIYSLNHNGNSITEISDKHKTYHIPFKGKPDNLLLTEGQLVITAHDSDALYVSSLNIETGEFRLLFQKNYPYGETTFDTSNSAFFMRGQFGDSLFSITQMVREKNGNLWITDFLSGKLFILTL